MYMTDKWALVRGCCKPFGSIDSLWKPEDTWNNLKLSQYKAATVFLLLILDCSKFWIYISDGNVWFVKTYFCRNWIRICLGSYLHAALLTCLYHHELENLPSSIFPYWYILAHIYRVRCYFNIVITNIFTSPTYITCYFSIVISKIFASPNYTTC